MAASPRRTDSWRVSPPATTRMSLPSRPWLSSRATTSATPSAGAATTTRPTARLRVSARTACTRSGTPPRSRRALGAPGPSRSPRPAAGTTAAAIAPVAFRFHSFGEVGMAMACTTGADPFRSTTVFRPQDQQKRSCKPEADRATGCGASSGHASAPEVPLHHPRTVGPVGGAPASGAVSVVERTAATRRAPRRAASPPCPRWCSPPARAR